MRRMLIVAMIFTTLSTALPLTAEGGPLLDWWRTRPKLFGKKQPVVTTYMPPVGTCTSSCPQVCQRVSVSYEPQTSYRSTWVQTPITSYRPETTTDPLTGCQVTCVKPCTTYQWSLKRVPHTTYRPVYQTQTVQMPAVTTGSCNTCAVPQPAVVTTPVANPYGALTYSAPAAGGMPISGGMPATGAPMAQPTLPNGVTPGAAPADMMPTLNPNDPTVTNRIVVPPTLDANGNPVGSSILNESYRQPVPGTTSPPPSGAASPMNVAPPNGSTSRMPQRIESSNSNSNQHNPIVDPAPGVRRTQPSSAPPLWATDQNTASVSLHRPWEYSPIQLAVYEQPQQNEPQRFHAPTSNMVPVQATPTPARRIRNDGWQSLDR